MVRLLAGLMVLTMALPGWAVEMGDDGLHKTAWMRDTFKDLREDLEEANSLGLRLMLIFEQRGCIYCDEMHEKTFPDPTVDALLHENYFVVQLNLHGDTEVVDFDGEALSEKQIARKWGVLFTPMMVFLPQEVPEDRSAIQAAVASMPGAFGPGTTQDMLTWVVEERYLIEDGEDFQRYHARRIQERNDGSTD